MNVSLHWSIDPAAALFWKNAQEMAEFLSGFSPIAHFFVHA